VCDVDEATRKARAFERPGMTDEKWAALKKRRLPDAAQRQLAQHLIPTGGTLADTQKAVETLYAELLKKPAQAWPARWEDELSKARLAERR
jgi:dephospho-CoA kinase